MRGPMRLLFCALLTIVTPSHAQTVCFKCADGALIYKDSVDNKFCDCQDCSDESNWDCTTCASGCPTCNGGYTSCETSGWVDTDSCGLDLCVEPTTILDDPHFHTAHGDRFDFKGRNNTVYNLVSHTNISVNSLFMYADFKTPLKKLVHGSFMRAAFVAVRTNESRMLHVEYSSNRSLSASVGINNISHKVSADQALHVDNVHISLKDRALTVTTPEWLVVATSKTVPGILGATTCATGRCIINVQVKPLFDVDHAKVAPHGLIGQSWDGDDVAVHGMTDDYSRKEVTTMAMGEGSIEGVAEQYEMPSGFATDFAFSRFGSTSASPRNVSALSGTKVKRSTSAVVVD